MTWNDVQALWRTAEEEHWRAEYVRRGFADWWEWRKTYVDDLGLDRREWRVEVVPEPLTTVPSWFLGGWRGWKQYVPPDVAAFPTFADVARHPALRDNRTVMDMVGQLRPTRLIALRCGGETAVLDGTHRAAAIAVMAHDGGYAVPPIEIAVADIEPELFERFRRGRLFVSTQPFTFAH